MKRPLPKLLFLFSLLLLGAAYGVKSYPVITLKEIDISGSNRITADNIPVALGQNIFDIDLSRVVNVVYSSHFVETVSARIDHTGKLLVKVVEKVPVAYIYLDDLYAITARGELVPSNIADTIFTLPVIQGFKADTVGMYQVINSPALRSALKLIKDMREKHADTFANLSEVRVNDAGLGLIFEPGSVVVNFGWGDNDKKIERMQNILSSNKNPGLDLDMRLVDLAVMRTRTINKEASNGI
jgi:cell division septal protein FtsQ